MQNYTSMHKKAEITKLLEPVLRFEWCEFIIFRALPIFMDFIDSISNHEIKNNICIYVQTIARDLRIQGTFLFFLKPRKLSSTNLSEFKVDFKFEN
jgi:hypothetical protein